MGAQRVEVHPVGLERRVVARRRRTARAGGPSRAYCRRSSALSAAGLIEEAEVGTLHVEAERRDAALVRGKGLEDAAQQELDRAGLGGEAGDAGDVEVRRLGAEQEVAVEVDRRLEPARRVEPDRDAGRRARRRCRHPSGARARRRRRSRAGPRPSGTGCSGSSGIWRSTAAVKSRISRAPARLEAGGHRIAVGADDGVHRA